MKPTNKWQLINYFDVWGNANDGWEVNNLCKEDHFLENAPDKSDEELINWLKEINFLNDKATTKTIEVWDDSEMIEFSSASDLEPIGRLERVYE